MCESLEKTKQKGIENYLKRYVNHCNLYQVMRLAISNRFAKKKSTPPGSTVHWIRLNLSSGVENYFYEINKYCPIRYCLHVVFAKRFRVRIKRFRDLFGI